jgi:hypothetical protein
MSGRWAFWVVSSCSLVACNFTPAETSGGADLPARGACPRGLAVVSSDFASSEIALLSTRGEVASAAFMSSASTAASNLAAPLSGDLAVAPSRLRPNELVLIDRQGTNVLTFVDAKTATVRAQLPVGGSGFESNPQDYLEIDEHRALVPRLGENNLPGREPFDSGSDLLVIDPSVPVITGSIPLPRRSGFLPNPVAVTRVADDLLVTLHHARADYSGLADSEIVAFSAGDQSVRYRLSLSGLRNCGRVEVAPSGRFLAVACSAHLDRNGAVGEPETSGLVLLDPDQTPPVELQRFAALDLIGGPIQSHIEFVTDDLLLIKSQTALGADEDNQLLSLDLERGSTRVLARAARAPGASGLGIALRGMRCGVACGDPCFVADASRGQLLRLDHGPAGLAVGDPVLIEGAGLPPSGLTPYW